jgi:hypothetical protein
MHLHCNFSPDEVSELLYAEACRRLGLSQADFDCDGFAALDCDGEEVSDEPETYRITLWQRNMFDGMTFAETKPCSTITTMTIKESSPSLDTVGTITNQSDN